MNFIIRLHRLYLSFVGKWKVVFKLREAEERQGCLWNSQSHRFRIFLIIKMSGYEKCQNMSSPSSGACLAGLIKSSGCYNKDLTFLSVLWSLAKERKREGVQYLVTFILHIFLILTHSVSIFVREQMKKNELEDAKVEGWRMAAAGCVCPP